MQVQPKLHQELSIHSSSHEDPKKVEIRGRSMQYWTGSNLHQSPEHIKLTRCRWFGRITNAIVNFPGGESRLF